MPHPKPKFIDQFDRSLIYAGGRVKEFASGKLIRNHRFTADGTCFCPIAAAGAECEHVALMASDVEVAETANEQAGKELLETLVQSGQSRRITVAAGWAPATSFVVIHNSATIIVVGI